MKVHTLECELVTPLPLEETFRVFENPNNLSRITPEWLNLTILTSDIAMKKGLTIDYKLRWLGVPLRWKTVISEYQPPHLFVDEALNGPYRFWKHRHEFKRDPDGTHVIDHVDYVLPFGLVGRVAHELVVARQLRQIFSHRQKALLPLLGGKATVLQHPVTSERVI